MSERVTYCGVREKIWMKRNGRDCLCIAWSGESPCRHTTDLPPHYKYRHAHYVVSTVHIWCSSSFTAHLNMFSPSRKLCYSMKDVMLLQHTQWPWRLTAWTARTLLIQRYRPPRKDIQMPQTQKTNHRLKVHYRVHKSPPTDPYSEPD
jgi:hypothetical protein